MTTAAIAALALSQRRRVAVLKPAQTGVRPGEPGDLADVERLVGAGPTLRELRRYPDPLSPEAAARRSGLAPLGPVEIARAATELDADHDLTLIEGAGGLLVRFDERGNSLADVAWALGAPVVVVAEAGLGTLNATALTAEVATKRGLNVAGVVIGSWPDEPDLAALCNLEDLPVAAGAPLLGVLPAGLGAAGREDFLAGAGRGLSPWFGGQFDPECFAGSASAQK
ncbi:ATP-dependent dethiobiotin synthetase BioD [Amycolatopsis sp. H20-H5]|uniref:ATP-dependent dethiobiotin synthetase BioD n=1 Tax=Amycolatopsis sp. H20-H5 TaxID=3046309 RepID=UPI002DB5EDFE|nr:dethiobiotin synthase [Amycolatopsis sp. H20-H5]MEC3978351.1 dethiobiotin synthase [Amycolatopsis sp. H20-H5]